MKLSKTILIAAMGLMASADCYAYINHEVSRSETLWGIAHKYKVSPDDIIKANPNAAKGVKTGMVLRIPEANDLQIKESAPASRPPQQIETVAPSPTIEHPQNASNEAAQQLKVEEIYLPDVMSAKETIVTTTPPSETIGENVYVARFGDTFFSISRKTGVSVADLLAYNPLVDPNHIKEGYIVRLAKDSPYIITDTSVNLVDSIIYKLQPESDLTSAGTSAERSRTIALMLPFDVENEVISRHSLLATDFYKGFLMALKHASGNGNMPIKIIAIDTQCDSLTFNHRLNQLVEQEVSIVIPPEDEKQLDRVQQFALQNNILVLNSLNIKDEGYQRYPNVLQCNISQKLMYDKALQALRSDFADYTPVILDIQGAKEEKVQFVDDLRREYRKAGLDVVDLMINNRLTDDDLLKLSSKKKYVFIPKSGSVDVFNKFSETLVKAIENDPLDRRFKVFGYPDWITFRGEQEEMLHRMGANIYSRFFMDETRASTRDVNDEYIRWYGYQMEDVYPSQGMLGYDVGTMLFEVLSKKWPDNDFNKFESGTYRGEQSTFHFVQDETDSDGVVPGLINDSLYIVEFLPATGVFVKSI